MHSENLAKFMTQKISLEKLKENIKKQLKFYTIDRTGVPIAPMNIYLVKYTYR